jgi:hypothetical protein
MYPGMAFSRSFGDVISHKIGVTSEPSIEIMDTSDDDLSITIASEEVWSFVTPDDISKLTITSTDTAICDAIVAKALKKKSNDTIKSVSRESYE